MDKAPAVARSLGMEKRDLGRGEDNLGEPEEFRWEQSGPGWTFTVEGQHYPVLN